MNQQKNVTRPFTLVFIKKRQNNSRAMYNIVTLYNVNNAVI